MVKTAGGEASTEAPTKPGKVTKKTTRSNHTYISKLLKQYGVSAKSDVVDELEKMNNFVLDEVLGVMKTITTKYVKKTETVKPRLVQAGFQVALSGTLRDDACASASDVLISYIEEKKAAAEASAKKKGSAAVA